MQQGKCAGTSNPGDKRKVLDGKRKALSTGQGNRA